MTFSALVIGGSGYLAGVTVTDDAGETSEFAASFDDIQRVGREHAEARRKEAQGAEDAWDQQYWLVQRRLFETSVSVRELRNAKLGIPVEPPSDADDETDTKETHISTMSADTKLGDTSTIGYAKQGDKYVIYASARMTGGYRAVLHVQDTETWEVLGGDSLEGVGDGVSDYHLTVWAELEPGKRYRAEVWTVQTLEDGAKRSGTKRQVFIEPEVQP